MNDSVAAVTITPTTGIFGTITSLISTAIGLIGSIIPLLFAAAFALVLYAGVMLIYKNKEGDVKATTIYKNMLVWGIVVLFVMSSIWGLVAVLNETTGITPGGAAPALPQLPRN